MDPLRPGENQQQQGTSSTARRRSSSGLFQGLKDARRYPAPSTRRQSFNDQKPEPGIFGRLWRSFTEGPPSPPK
ncbi:hypothetical protein SODALDRAFT_334490 [Sodiomyces alkalinus F11]|uniref:Conidiation-specific protein 8 n=1 Tax=Sodiomyces alkalinus (strain CBS 110278 / VKM F-3762 / F11) TaxID=1314773 RepID=A0A3N2PSB8_SODAK|nr:hypothetical protein SODALDRAFT_334490 [Sodiomyces alkalinus F11]ROT37397.1 hypothetical protein SODALDRAFT_334490 [Sodiomyces alkalinus F11]